MYSHTLTLLFLATLISTTTSSCLHGTSLDPRHLLNTRVGGGVSGIGNKTVAVKDFSYTGTRGPLMWHNITTANSACRTGRTQSPINLSNGTIERTEPGCVKLTVPELANGAEIENLGTTVEVVMEGKGGEVEFPAGKKWEVKQFHFHTPSEHRVEEEYFPLEMHMVTERKAADGKPEFLVLAMMFQLVDPEERTSSGNRNTNNTKEKRDNPTSPTSLISTALSRLPIKPGGVGETPPLSFTALVNEVSKMPFFHYIGSLTTPPCSEGVTFLVMQRPLGLDVKTYNAVKRVVKFNSRYTQNALGQENLLELACVK